MRTLLALLALALTAACQGEHTTTTTLDDGTDAVKVDAHPTTTPEGSPAPPGGSGDHQTGASAQPAGDLIDPWRGHPTQAEPGTWAVADAGSVTFALTDRGLVLIDVAANEGWDIRVAEDSAEEVEVEFTQGHVRHEIEVERDRSLTVAVRSDYLAARPGVYDLGAAGSLEWTVDGDALRLVDVVVADGWQLRRGRQSDEEITLALVRGAEGWAVELKRRGRRIELATHYEVVG